MLEIVFEDVTVFSLEDSSILDWYTNVSLQEYKELGDVTIIFCSDDYLLEVNREHLNHDYFTDIIIDCFAVGTVPIFWGTPNIKNYFNMNGVIVMDSLNDVEDIVKNCNENAKRIAKKKAKPNILAIFPLSVIYLI